MSGLGGANGNLCRIVIPNFAHKYDIWVVSQDRSKTTCERESDIVASLNLRNAVHLIFHRILNGHDLPPFVIGLGQGSKRQGVERCLSSEWFGSCLVVPVVCPRALVGAGRSLGQPHGPRPLGIIVSGVCCS